MEPIALATVTAGVTVVAMEAVKGFATEAGKETWGLLKRLFGWSADPPLEEIAPAVAARLQSDPEIARQVVALLQQHQGDVTTAAAIVGRVTAEKVVAIGQQTVHGTQNISL
jgi:hypothetical protein